MSFSPLSLNMDDDENDNLLLFGAKEIHVSKETALK